jgi:hypothetical protein
MNPIIRNNYGNPRTKIWKINRFGFKEIMTLSYYGIPDHFIKQGWKELKK